MKFRTTQAYILFMLLSAAMFSGAARAESGRSAAKLGLYRLASRPGVERVYDSSRRAFRCGVVKEKRRLKVYAGKT